MEEYPFQLIVKECKEILDKLPVYQRLDSVLQNLAGLYNCTEQGEYKIGSSQLHSSEWQKWSKELVSKQFSEYIKTGTNTSLFDDKVKAPTQSREFQVNSLLFREMAAKIYIQQCIDYFKMLKIYE
jgi:hypothetical protein